MSKPSVSRGERSPSVWQRIRQLERSGMVVLLALLVLGVFVVPAVLPSGPAGRLRLTSW